MLLTSKCVFLNAEKKAGIKDVNKTYYLALLMQGTEAIQCSMEQKLYEEVLSQMPQYTPLICEFDYNSQFRSIRLVGAKK